MRIASVAKAFSGAVALQLVRRRRLGLDDTIGQRLPGMPARGRAVTVRQMLDHTSGLPDYTQSDGFAEHVRKRPRVASSRRPRIIDWVAPSRSCSRRDRGTSTRTPTTSSSV